MLSLDGGSALAMTSSRTAISLRFLPDVHFEVGTLLRNTSNADLVITDVRVVEPPRTLIHQIGTAFHRWHPRSCPPNTSCGPDIPFRMHPRANRPQPYTVHPGREFGVELDFALGSCSQIAGANPAPLTRARVGFHRPGGRTEHRVLALGYGSIVLRTPKPGDCADPRSSLDVDGVGTAIATSTGDVCSVRNGRLYFESRKYRTSGAGLAERVTLQVGRFTGVGTYKRTTVKLAAGKHVTFRLHGSPVRVTAATSRQLIATIDAARRPFHISGTLRCRVIR